MKVGEIRSDNENVILKVFQPLPAGLFRLLKRFFIVFIVFRAFASLFSEEGQKFNTFIVLYE